MNFPQRKSIRSKNYDYSLSGLYFITICTQSRQNLFGEISVGVGFSRPIETIEKQINPIETKMKLNNLGKIINNEFFWLPQKYTNTKLHEYVIMPNHFHCIIEIIDKNSGHIVQQNPLNNGRENPTPYDWKYYWVF